MDNIAFFNRLTLSVFDRLYSSFPTPIDLMVEEIAMSVIPEEADFEETRDNLQAAEDAIDFLAQEGFLTHNGTYVEGGTFLRARLTLKGLAILGYTLEGKQSLIDRIRKVLAGGAKEAGTEVVKTLAQQAFSAALAATPALLTTITK